MEIKKMKEKYNLKSRTKILSASIKKADLREVS